MKVLVVEDEPRVARLVGRALAEAGHDIELAHDGVAGLAAAQRSGFDVVVLDALLPDLDGLAVCRRLRQDRNSTPILMLTGRDGVARRVRGLDAGADDYLVKPFALEEMLARVRALGRGLGDEDGVPTLRVGELTLHLASYEAERAGRSISLTAKEFSLLRYLMCHPGQVLSKEQITDHVWGYDSAATSNVVEIYIHYLRDKIDRGFDRPLIRTVRGVGYTIKA